MRYIVAILGFMSVIFLTHATTTTELKQAQSFYASLVHFDYCGCAPVELNETYVGICDKQLLSMIDFKCLHLERQQRCLEALRHAEQAARQHNHTLFMSSWHEWRSNRDQLVEEETQTNKNSVGYSLHSKRTLISAEYLLGRIVEENLLPLTFTDVRELLPDELFQNQLTDLSLYRELSILRDCITIGAALRVYQHQKGTLPTTLAALDISLPLLADDRLRYEVRDSVWQLVYFDTMYKGLRDRLEFNTYVPAIQLTPRTDGCTIWYSSDYAKKRVELYQTGVLNDTSKNWRCVLYRGELIFHAPKGEPLKSMYIW